MKLLRQSMPPSVPINKDDPESELFEFVPKVKYSLTKDGSVLNFTFTLTDIPAIEGQISTKIIDTLSQSEDIKLSQNNVFNVPIDLTKYKGQVIDIEYSGANTMPVIMITPSFTNFSLGGNLPNRLLRSNELRLARVTSSLDGTDSVIQLMFPSDEISGFENIVMTNNKTFLQWLLENSQVANTIISKTKKKSRLLSNIDARDSIAYLEAQLDALVQYILSGNTDQDSLDILNAAKQYSVMDSRSKEDLIGEMEHKHNVRVQLQKYYSDAKTLES